LSWSISSDVAQFTLEMHVAAQNCEKFTKISIFGGSRSFKIIVVGTPGKLVGSAWGRATAEIKFDAFYVENMTSGCTNFSFSLT